MCLLTYIPQGTDPDMDALQNGTYLNPDGFGYAIVADRRIVIGRDMDAARALEQFEAMRQIHYGDALFHSRLATDGANDIGNVHPFPVGGNPLVVVGHNGIITRCRPRKGDNRSDTRILAEVYLPQRNLNRNRSLRRLGDWVGKANKLVILSADPSIRWSARIINESSGMWHNGSWYSNDGYRIFGTRARSTQWDICVVCDSFGLASQVWDWGMYCRTCGSCAYCEEQPSRCYCFADDGDVTQVSDDAFTSHVRDGLAPGEHYAACVMWNRHKRGDDVMCVCETATQ